jgi:monovalent cation:H+ antiporter-2, CPA2 family
MPIMKITERLADAGRRAIFQRSLASRECAHLDAARSFPVATTCPSCEAGGTEWLKLRMCMACGAAGCCDSSTGQHARRHFEATGHPMIQSIEPGEHWAWCYPDEAYLQLAA